MKLKCLKYLVFVCFHYRLSKKIFEFYFSASVDVCLLEYGDFSHECYAADYRENISSSSPRPAFQQEKQDLEPATLTSHKFTFLPCI